MILGTWFSLILGTRFSILGTRIGPLKHLKKLHGFILLSYWQLQHQCQKLLLWLESGMILVPDFWIGPDYDFCVILGSGSDLDTAKIFRIRAGLSNFNIRTTKPRLRCLLVAVVWLMDVASILQPGHWAELMHSIIQQCSTKTRTFLATTNCVSVRIRVRITRLGSVKK